ncbi:unknown [Firmicutes bacterium CAG:137]|nr:unknown [Firmicutes bacterium CAG:137]
MERRPGAQIFIKSQSGGQRLRVANGFPDLICGEVGGIVCRLNDELVACHAVKGHGERDGFAGLGIRGGAYGLEKLAAGYVVKQNASQILVIAGSDQHHIVFRVHFDFQYLGVLHIDCKGNLHGGAMTQGVPIHHTVVDVILRRQSQAQKAGFPHLYIRVQAELQILGRSHPGCVQGIVECSGDRTAFAVGQRFAGCGIHSCEAGGGSAPDWRKAPLVEEIASGGIDGVALGKIVLIRHDGVAAEIPDLSGIIAVNHTDGVTGGIAQIGAARFLSSGVGNLCAHVEHGCIAPIAIEAQNGDAQSGEQLSISGSQRNSLYKGLHIGAIGIFCIQPCLLAAGQCHCDIYCDGATGGNFHSALVQAQELMHIVSIYLAVAVHIGIVGICR